MKKAILAMGMTLAFVACVSAQPNTSEQSLELQTACFPSEFDVDCGVVPREDGGFFDVAGAMFGLPVPSGVSETTATCTGGGYNTVCLSSFTDGYVHRCWISHVPGAGYGIACSMTPSS